MLKVGIVGLGTISEIHIAAIKQIENAKLVALCDIDATKQAIHPAIPFFTDVEEMLKTGDVDVVHICLPHHLHVPVGKRCVEYGIPFFTEKPLGIDYASANELVTFAEEKQIKAGLCFQNRYNPTFIRLQEELKNVTQSEIKGIKGLVIWAREADYYIEKPWRGTKKEAGYGTVINQSIHTLDLMQIVGGAIKEGHGQLATYSDLPIEVEDSATGVFEFEAGAKAYFHATNCYVFNDSIELQVVLGNRIYTIKDNTLFVETEKGKVKLVEDETLAGEKYYYGASHRSAMEAFYQAIEENTEEYIHIRDGLATLEMIERMAGIWEEKK